MYGATRMHFTIIQLTHTEYTSTGSTKISVEKRRNNPRRAEKRAPGSVADEILGEMLREAGCIMPEEASL